ncbi:MAG: 2-amino-4-hydroxy-6-hydroxymethyldihydropteridine diphosphokinase [Hyphomicrobiaceae bacterium]
MGAAVTGSVVALLAIGANVPGVWGDPLGTLSRLPGELEALGIAVMAASPLYATAPVGPVNQPGFLNGALKVTTELPPLGLIAVLKALERKAGRIAGMRWGPRPLDIDIIAYGDRVIDTEGPHGRLVVPHAEVARRDFVLKPLVDVAPGWRHPVTGLTASEMLERLPPD